MALALDILVVLVFVLLLVFGIKRGFVRSIMGIAVTLLAIVGSYLFAPTVAAVFQEKFMDGAVVGQVEKSLTDVANGSSLPKLFSEAPKGLTDLLDRLGVDFTEVRAFVDSRDSQTEDSIHETAEHIGLPLSAALSKGAAYLALYLGLCLVLTLIALLIDRLTRLPGLNITNKALGGLLGAVLGLLFAWGISAALCAFLPQAARIFEGKIPEGVIENTVIVKILGRISLI